jgi:hypothetical protein
VILTLIPQFDLECCIKRFELEFSSGILFSSDLSTDRYLKVSLEPGMCGSYL